METSCPFRYDHDYRTYKVHTLLDIRIFKYSPHFHQKISVLVYAYDGTCPKISLYIVIIRTIVYHTNIHRNISFCFGTGKTFVDKSAKLSDEYWKYMSTIPAAKDSLHL